VAWTDHVTYFEVLKRTDQRPLQDIVAERRFKFAGHTLRQAGTRPVKRAMNWIPVVGRRKRRPSKKNMEIDFP